MHAIVLRVRRLDRAGEAQQVPVQLEIGGRLVGEEFVARFQRRAVQQPEIGMRDRARCAGVAGTGQLAGPVQSPFEGTHHAIGGAANTDGSPRQHPLPVQRLHPF